MNPSVSTLMRNTTKNNNTLDSTLVNSNKWCLPAPTGSISWWMNRLSTQSRSRTTNSLHYPQQALTTISSPKQSVLQILWTNNYQNGFLRSTKVDEHQTKMSLLFSIRRMNWPPTRSNSRSNNPLLATIATITAGINAFSSLTITNNSKNRSFVTTLVNEIVRQHGNYPTSCTHHLLRQKPQQVYDWSRPRLQSHRPLEHDSLNHNPKLKEQRSGCE